MDDFIRQRLGCITASKDFGRIIRGEFLVKEKVDEVLNQKPAKDVKQTGYMYQGTVMEQEAQDELAKARPGDKLLAVHRTPIKHKDTQYISATPDMISKKKRYLIEIKCPQTDQTIGHARKMEFPPKQVLLQVQAQLYVVGYKKAEVYYYNTTAGIISKFLIKADERYFDLFNKKVWPQAKAIASKLNGYGIATPTKEKIQ